MKLDKQYNGYLWVKKKYNYFKKTDDKGWQGSIKSCLSSKNITKIYLY